VSKTPKIRLDKKPEIVIFYRLKALREGSDRGTRHLKALSTKVFRLLSYK
jgi:hypothetical protein